NGNYAIQAGLNPTKDAVILEQADATNPYVNIVAVQEGRENDPAIKTLIEVLKSDEVKQFILDTYSDGSVIPAE
ncbi:MAG: MetQ/NlpA family ABC transporter substrate-binding protein, partial [Anaerorhabdus sp.]